MVVAWPKFYSGANKYFSNLHLSSTPRSICRFSHQKHCYILFFCPKTNSTTGYQPTNRASMWLTVFFQSMWSFVSCYWVACSYSESVSPPLLPQWHVKDPGHFAKSAGGRLPLNTHTPLTQRSRSGLTILSVGTYPETRSHATCHGTFGHSRLSSLSHCGLILAYRVKLV